MRRSFLTTRLIVKASRMLSETVGVLSDPECGAAMCVVGNSTRRVVLWRTSTASSGLEFVIVPSIFVDETKYEMISGGQGWRHTKFWIDPEGSIYISPAPRSEA